VEHARIGKWLTKNPFLLLYLLWNRVCVHKVIFVSHQSLELLPGLKRSVVIPNGIDLTLFNPEIRHIHAINVLPHKAKGEIWVGTITRLSKDKGIPDLIQATLMLRKKIPQLNCWIVGEGTEEKNLKKAFKERCVHFVGAIKHEYVADFMRQLDVFVLPSCLHDPFGLVAAEAMAVGRPLLVTEVCGIVDFLKNGVHALIVPARNPKRLSSALMKLLTDEKLRVRMAHAGFEHARKRFDVERMVDEYVKELEK